MHMSTVHYDDYNSADGKKYVHWQVIYTVHDIHATNRRHRTFENAKIVSQRKTHPGLWRA
jgi:hypothetical protein